jgi:hypothetical protein
MSERDLVGVVVHDRLRVQLRGLPLSGGRFTTRGGGVGVTVNLQELIGDEAGERLREAVEAVRAVWGGRGPSGVRL